MQSLNHVYAAVIVHSLETATRYSHLNKKDVRDAMFKNVYGVEEISEEKKNEYEKEIESLNNKYAKIMKFLKITEDADDPITEKDFEESDAILVDSEEIKTKVSRR